jgi:hypothetical protein
VSEVKIRLRCRRLQAIKIGKDRTHRRTAGGGGVRRRRGRCLPE